MNDKLVCKICNRECKKYSSLAYHIKMIHKIDSKIYYDLYLKKINEGICKTCGKITRYYGLQKGYCKFCSTKCSNSDPEIKEKLSIAGKNKPIKPKKQQLTKEELKIRSSKNRSIAQLKRFSKPEEIKKISNSQKEHFKNMDENIKKRKNEKNRKAQIIRYSKIEEREKISISTKNWMSSNDGIKFRKESRNRMLNGQASYMNSFIQNPSKPQVELFNRIKEIFPAAILNYPLIELNYSLDIAIPDLKIWIESDGSYWHQDSEKDLERQRKIELLGWKCIRYKADSIRDIPNINSIKKDINGVINYV